jgi:hypothetical protein
MKVDGRTFSRALANVLLFCPRTRPWVRFRLDGGFLIMMACDDYSVGQDSVEALDFAGWPDEDLYLCKEYAEELEKAARQAGGRGKDRGTYEFTSEAFTEGDKGQWVLSYRVDEVTRGWHSNPYQPVGFLPANLAKFCRVRRHDDKIAIMDVRIGDPVQVRVGTFVGIIKQIDREVYATRQDPEGLW